VSADDVLASSPLIASDPEQALELIYTEFAAREALGERPDPAAWYARFPQWRERLERLFEVHALLAETEHDGADVTREIAASRGVARPGAADDRASRLGGYELLEEIERGGM